MKHIIIALDSFKGCLSSQDAGMAAAEGVRLADPNASVKVMPLSDGGEGLTEVLIHALGGHNVTVQVHGPLMEPLSASYGIVGATAIIEMAAACGLPLVPIAQRNPLHTTTYGFGEMILDAIHRGCTSLILGIGGSATNDAGLGMLQALGAGIKMRNASGETVALGQSHRVHTMAEAVTGGMLCDVISIDTQAISCLENVSILVACDVQNPLCGAQGAACVFAPQKGADADAVKRLDAGLSHILYNICGEKTLPGDGAAGGLGFALRHFLHAQMQPGIELVLSQLHFDELLSETDLIITGEGKSDAQTLMGKVPMGVLKRALAKSKPVHLIAGIIEDKEMLKNNGFTDVHCINEGDNAPLTELMQADHAYANIRKTVARIVRSIS